MLVVHPASTCDVCLESYTGRSENLPYSISCGHVFCLSCLQSLRQHICPLCRSPFEASDVRRLHVDRTDAQRTSSPRSTGDQRSDLPADNALGLFDDIPRTTQLQQKVSDLVLRSSFTSGVRERGVRELIQEIHTFLSSEPAERHANLRASFLLLYRFTELQSRYQQLETSTFELRTENNRDKQAVADWERRFQDVQRSRARDQESAWSVESSLRERLRIEELEWQRKYDYVSEECAKLRDELDELRFSSSNVPDAVRAPRRSTPTTQLYFVTAEDGSNSAACFDYDHFKGVALGKDKGYSKAKNDSDMLSLSKPDLFHISPVPGTISLSISKQMSDSGDETTVEKHRRRAPESPSRTSSTSSNISRASDSAAALKPLPAIVPIPANSNRQRSDSNPSRRSDKAKAYRFDNQPEVSSSAPSSYMYRAASPTRTLFPATPPPPEAPLQTCASHEDVSQVVRLYSLLEKPVPATNPRLASGSSYLSKTRGSVLEERNSRPPLPRSMSFQHVRSSDFSVTPSASASPSSVQTPPPSLRRTQPRMQVQTSHLSAPQFHRSTVSSPQTPAQDRGRAQTSEALSPIQRTPPRPVLPHMHSYFSLHSPAPAKPVSPQENRIGARGSLPRRGSLSSASAAAALAAGSGSPAIVPPSSLGFGKSRARGLFGGQDSD